jgi:hypothetical protein
MADEHNNEPEQPDYEPPTVESLGSADELAKGNEGSVPDGATGPAG